MPARVASNGACSWTKSRSGFTTWPPEKCKLRFRKDLNRLFAPRCWFAFVMMKSSRCGWNFATFSIGNHEQSGRQANRHPNGQETPNQSIHYETEVFCCRTR